MSRPCLSCRALKGPGQYLCWTCWYLLPASTRRALSRMDVCAFARVRDLYAQIREGVPLDQIEVKP